MHWLVYMDEVITDDSLYLQMWFCGGHLTRAPPNKKRTGSVFIHGPFSCPPIGPSDTYTCEGHMVYTRQGSIQEF